MSRGFLLNLTLIQVGWFIAVLSAADGHHWPGPAFAAMVITLYLTRSANRRRESLLVLICMCLGLAVDTSLVQLDLVKFAASWPSESIAPAWTLGLWGLLATAFSRSMGWMSGQPVVAVMLAPVAALTYWGGAGLGAAEFPNGLTSGLIGIGVGWAVALPLLSYLVARILPIPNTRAEVARRSPGDRNRQREDTL